MYYFTFPLFSNNCWFPPFGLSFAQTEAVLCLLSFGRSAAALVKHWCKVFFGIWLDHGTKNNLAASPSLLTDSDKPKNRSVYAGPKGYVMLVNFSRISTKNGELQRECSFLFDCNSRVTFDLRQVDNYKGNLKWYICWCQESE